MPNKTQHAPSRYKISDFFSSLLENRSVRLYSINPSQGSVQFESTLANDLARADSCKVDFELVLRRPIETAPFFGSIMTANEQVWTPGQNWLLAVQGSRE